MGKEVPPSVDRAPEQNRVRIDRHEVHPKIPIVTPKLSKLERTLKALAIVTGSVCALLFVCFLFRAPILAAVADLWVVNEPVAKADAIIILGGGLENRPFAAANLYRDGVAPVVLYMNVHSSPAQDLGLVMSEGDVTRRILLKKDIPESALTMIGTNVASTFDETHAVRAWIEKNRAKSIVITTDSFHTRRARWIFRKELRGLDVERLIAFQNEIVKSIYYRLKY